MYTVFTVPALRLRPLELWISGKTCLLSHFLSVSSCCFSFYSSTLPTSVWNSSPIMSCPQPRLLLSRPYLCFPSFHLVFFLREGCRQTRKHKAAYECVLLISRTHIACWRLQGNRLRSESQRKMSCGWCIMRVGVHMWCCWYSFSHCLDFQSIPRKELFYGSLKGFQDTRKLPDYYTSTAPA